MFRCTDTSVDLGFQQPSDDVGIHAAETDLRPRLLEKHDQSGDVGVRNYQSSRQMSSCLGFLLDFRLISITNLYLASLVISGIAPMFSPLVTSLPGQLGLIVVYGIGSGILMPTTTLVCRQYVSIDLASSAIGLLTTVGGLGNLFSIQLMGRYIIPGRKCFSTGIKGRL